MTDVTKNITETNKETKALQFTRKKRSYKDIPLLIFIVAVAAFVMLGCGVLKEANKIEDTLPEENLDATTEVVEEQSLEDIAQNENSELARFDLAMATKVPVKNEYLSDGKLKIWFEDGTVDVFGDDHTAFGISIIDEDNEFGVAPLDEKQAVDIAMRYADAGATKSDKATFTGFGNQSSTTSTFKTPRSLTAGHTHPTQSSSFTCTSTATFTFYFSDGTWANLISKGKASVDSKSGVDSATLSTTNVTCTLVKSASSGSSSSGGCNPTYSGSSSVTISSGSWVKLKRSIVETPNAPTMLIADANGNYKEAVTEWTQSKKVQFKASTTYGLYKFNISYCDTKTHSTTATPTYTTVTSKTTGSYTTYGEASATATSSLGQTSGKTIKDAAALMIDSVNPTVTSVVMQKVDGKTVTSAYNEEVRLAVTCQDQTATGNKGTYSYIKKIVAKNTTLNITLELAGATSRPGSLNGTIITRYFNFKKTLSSSSTDQTNLYNANGSWTVTVYDAVGNYASKTYSYTYTDLAKPEYNASSQVLANAITVTTNNPNTTATESVYSAANGSLWTRTPLYVTIKLRDQVGTPSSTKNYYCAGIGKFSITMQNNATPITVPVSVTNSTTISGGSYYRTANYTFPVPYYVDSLSAFRIEIEDVAGNAMTSIGQSAFAAAIKGKASHQIDTIAPELKITTPTGLSTASTVNYDINNIDKDVTFRLTAREFTYDNKLGSGSATTSYYCNTTSYRYNNGSGVAKIEVYTNSQKTTKVPFYVGSSTTLSQGVYTVPGSSICYNLDITITIPQDKAGGASNGIYVVAYDKCGNASDMAASNYDSFKSNGLASSANAGYYVSQKSTSSGYGYTFYITKDYYKPQIVVRQGINNTSGTVIASTNGFNSSGTSYTFPWSTNSTTQNFTVYYYYGCSGGTFTSDGTTTTCKPYSTGSGTKISVNKTQNSSVEYGSKTTGNTSRTNSVSTTYIKAYKTFTIPDTSGSKVYKFSFKNNETVGTGDITITTQVDKTAPEIELLGFANSVVDQQTGIPASLTSESSLTKTWFGSNRDYYAVFKLEDEHSGIVSAITLNEGEVDTRVDAANAKTGAPAKKYGKNNTGSTQYANTNGSTSTYVNGLLAYNDLSLPAVPKDKNGNLVSTESPKLYYSKNSSYVFVFRYKGKSGAIYSYVNYGYATIIDNQFYVVVRMFDTTELGELAGFKTVETTDDSDGNGNYKQRDIWDIIEGTFLDYTFAARDFMGNSKTYCSPYVKGALLNGLNTASGSTDVQINSESNQITASYVLRYFVDPFPVYMDLSFYTIPGAVESSKFSALGKTAATLAINNEYGISKFVHDKATYDESIDGVKKMDGFKEKWAVYDDGKTNGVGAVWTKNTVIVEVKTIGSLSSTSVRYGTYNRMDVLGPPEAAATIDPNSITIAIKNTDVEWIVFDNSTSKNVKLDVQVSNDAGYTSLVQSKNDGSQAYYMLIKQDATPPELTKVFFSEKDDLESEQNAKLAFDAIYSGGEYIYVLDKDNSSAYVDGQDDPFVWSTQDLYIYFKVSDTFAYKSGSQTKYAVGSGPASIAIETSSGNYGFECAMVSKNKDGSVIYRGSRYGYNTKEGIKDENGNTQPLSLNFRIKDSMNNPKTGKYKEKAKENSTDTTATFHTFPVVDSVSISTSLNDASYAIGEDKYASYIKVGYEPKVLLGVPASNVVDVYITYTTGISGAKFYLKEAPYDDPSDSNTKYGVKFDELDLYSSKTSLPSGYILANKGWGAYVNGKFNEGAVAASRVSSNNESAVDLANESMKITIEMTSIKKRLYLLAVSGTGTYYVIDLGMIFIDTDPVAFDSNMTIFTMESSASSTEEETYGEMAYSNMQTIWTNVVGDTYTNGKVYIYYQLSDGASGIDDNTVLYNNNTKLEKILVTGIPVWHVDGKPTNARIYDTNAAFPSADKSGEYVEVGGVETNLLSSKVSSTTVTIGYIDEIYYRLLVSSTGDYTIWAKDNAGNYWEDGNSHTKYSISIDYTPVKITSKTYYASTNSEYKGSLVDYTNDDVIMKWEVEYGDSGFSHIAYSVVDNFEGIVDQYAPIYNLCVPKISISSNNTFVLEYIGDNGKAQKHDTNINKTDSVKVTKGYTGCWFVNDKSTYVKVSSYYSDFGGATYTIDYSKATVTLEDAANKGVARKIYDELKIPTISVDANNKIALTYLNYNGEKVQIATNATSNAINEITTRMVEGVYYWVVNDTTTSARVAAEPFYPNAVHGVKWSVKGTGTNAIISVTDKYSEIYEELRVPTVKYNSSNKIVITYYNGSQFIGQDTSVSKPSGDVVNIEAKRVNGFLYWHVEGVNTRILVKTDYYGSSIEGKKWGIEIKNNKSNKLTCSFTISRTDESKTYTVWAYNNVNEEYSIAAVQEGIEIEFINDDKRETAEYEEQSYNAIWNINFGSQTLGYVDYEVIDSKGNLFTNSDIEIPTVSFSNNNTIVIGYIDPQGNKQSYDTGLSATKDVITLKISQNPSIGAQCFVDNSTDYILVNPTDYKASLSPTWIYDFRANTITLQDRAGSSTGLAHNTFDSVLSKLISVTVQSTTVKLTAGGVSQGSDVIISAKSDGIVKLNVKKNGATYNWYLNDVNTKLAVSNDYPINYYDVVWYWNAKNSTDYKIVDNIAHASVHMRVPTISKEGSKIKITYVNDLGVTDSDLIMDWPSDSIITLSGVVSGANNVWEIETTGGASVNVNMSKAYNSMLIGTTWKYNFAERSVMLTLPVTKNNANVNYIITAGNTQQEIEFNRPVSNRSTSIVSMDVTAPIIDISVGNVAELNATDVWHALAKSLRVSIYDSMSGIGEKIDSSDDNVYLEVYANNSNNKIYLVKCEDGLYRAYNDGELYYLDQNVTYKLFAYDRAGNVSGECLIKPMIDTVTANVTNLTAYDRAGNKYLQNGTPSVKWLQDTGISSINWTSDYVYVTMNVTYGKSGYALYVSNNYKKNQEGGLTAAWTLLNTSNYTVVLTKDNGNGTKTDTIKYEIGSGANYLYGYYMFRALSNAQNTELNVYKSYTDASKPRATVEGKSTPGNVDYKIKIQLESYEAEDQNVTDGYAYISIGSRVITDLIAIDKTAPTLTVKAQDVRSIDYGNRYNNNNLIWEIPDGKWVNTDVTMSITLSSSSNYLSGNAFFYRAYAKDLSGTYKWSDWTMVLPTGKVYVKQDGKWTLQSGTSTNVFTEGGVRYYNGDESVTVSYYANSLKYTIRSSTDNEVYEYYTETGAGIRSSVGTIGRIDGNNVYGIKIDTNEPTISASGKATYETFNGTPAIDIQDKLKASYLNSNNKAYSVTASATWTYYDTIVIGIAISNVGYSGVIVHLGGEIFDEISYQEYIKETTQAGSSIIYRYYYITKNGETKKDIQATNVAGSKSEKTSVYARIDNTTPIVYVSSIDGTKATNWGWAANKNLYSGKVEYWYVSETEINLGVGIVENNAFTNKAPYSGYEIEYQVNGTGEWLPVAGDVLRFSGIGDNVINGDVYTFRITSGAGLYYNIGAEIINNHIEKNTDISFHEQAIVNTIATVVGSKPVQSHVIKGNEGNEVLDYEADKSLYQMFVDANRYSYTYNGKVYLGEAYGYDINTNNFMTYSAQESDANGNFSETFDTQFHRGDVLKLTYNAKYNAVTSAEGSGYNYFHDYTEGAPNGVVEKYCENEEKTGTFSIQFVNNHVNLIGYFIAEVRVNYGGNNTKDKDVFYKQVDGCSQIHKHLIEDAAINVLSCSCNSLTALLDNEGKVSDLDKRTEVMVSNYLMGRFDSLSNYFAELMSNYAISNILNEWRPSTSSVAYADYVDFFNEAKAIYNNSNSFITKNLNYGARDGAVVGINNKYSITFDAYSNYDNLLLAVARLFGYEDDELFVRYVQILADFYKKNVLNEKSTISEKLKFDGAIGTSNSTYVLPFVFESELAPIILTYLIVDKNGNVSIWVNDVNAVIRATKVNSSYKVASSLVSVGRCILFEMPRSMATTGTASYEYFDGNTIRSVPIELQYEYYQYRELATLSHGQADRVEIPVEVGAYYVYTQAKSGDGYGKFRITNENSANGATDYKDFVIKYFVEHEKEKEGEVEPILYYLINNTTDFYYVDDNYYNIDENGKIISTPSTYLAGNYVLNNNLIISKRLEGTFAGTFNANSADHEIKETEGEDSINTITILVDGVSNGKNSVFERVDGIVKNLEVVLSDVMTISVDASATTNVGILAGEVNGIVHNVSVTGDIVLDGVNTSAGKVNVGGLAGKLGASAVLGQNSDLVYVDVRITNNGDLVKNANVSSLAGYVTSGTTFSNVQVFGEVTVYNVDGTVNIGTVYGDADEGYYNALTLNYFANNAFLNDYTVSGASSSNSAVTINGIQAVDYAAMATNETTVAGKMINDMIIDRLYRDFGYSYNGEDTAYGIGTADSPLIISTVEQLMAIDGYMNLSYVVDKDVKILDMSDYDATVAIHKVFNGTFDTEDKEFVVLNNFAGNVDTFDGNYFGLFGQLNGQVNNVVFGDIAVDFTYEGSNALYAGLVAGKIYQDAVINNIVLIGTQKITSTNGAVYAGGIVGSANGGRIYDVFSMNNISVNGSQVVAGGIAGSVNNLHLYNEGTDGAIYLLGRVEGNASSLVVGSAIGSGTLADDAKNVYAIVNNTYNNGAVLESKPIGSTSDSYGIKMVEFTNSDMRSSSFASGKNAFNLVFSQYYPLQGNGTANSPFIVESAEDFGYINIALYANYSITKSITFTDFTTIGEGLVFSGSINGSGGDNISAEESSIASLSGLDAPLVYNSTGSITNISLNIVYENTVKSGETFYFGAVAIYNSGTIKNVTVAGSVDVTSETNDTTLYVSGFVGVNYGGDILLEGTDEQISKIQNSISALNVTINGGGTAYVGGYAGVIEQGQPKFSYGLATGTITVTDVQTVYAGLFAGASYGECEWVLGEAASIDYTYTITVDGVTIPKTDENGDPIVDNFYGVEFIK